MTRVAFLMDVDTLEEFYNRCLDEDAVTVEQKNAVLLKLMQEKKAEMLGTTDKTAPELATEFIKKGINAKSYVKGL